MSSSVLNDSGSDSPLSTLSDTPSPPNSPAKNISLDKTRVEVPVFTARVAVSTPPDFPTAVIDSLSETTFTDDDPFFPNVTNCESNKKIHCKKHDISTADEQPKPKRTRTRSKKAPKSLKSGEDFKPALETPSPTFKKNQDRKGSNSPLRITFTSGGIDIAAAAAKVKHRTSKKVEVVNYSKRGPGRPRKQPLPDKEATAKAAVNNSSPAKRTLELTMDMNDRPTVPEMSQENPSKGLNDSASNSSVNLEGPKPTTSDNSQVIVSANINNSLFLSAKKGRTTLQKVARGVTEATRASIRPKKLSPKAREALGENAPVQDDSEGLTWGYQEDGSWKEPKLLTKADHEREKEERELRKRNSKGTGVKNRSRKMTVRQWKEKFGAVPPTLDYGKAEEEKAAKEAGVDRSQIREDLKSEEEELKEVSDFYKIEMSCTYHHPKVENETYSWASSHTRQAPESNVRTADPEPGWKTRKYEAELAGKFDNYSAPFKAFWEEPKVKVEESNVRGK